MKPRTYNELQYRLAEKYGGIGVPDASGDLVNPFVLLAADEAQYNKVVGHAIIKGLANWKAKTIEALPEATDRAYVEALLKAAALEVSNELEPLHGKVVPAEEMARLFIAHIDALVDIKVKENKGAKHGL